MTEEADIDVLRAVFASRVATAKLTVHEAVQQAEGDWQRTQLWVLSKSEKKGSFLWFCDFFDLEPDAVRRAIREKRQ